MALTKTEVIMWLQLMIKEMKRETRGNYHYPEYKDEVYEALEYAIEYLKREDKE